LEAILDTCTLIWLCCEPKNLSLKATETIDSVENSLSVSHVSIWEMALKQRSGKMVFPKPLRRWIFEQRAIWRFEWIPISLDHILRTTELPDHHNDPFDRLLIAQALKENIPIITPDVYIKQYPVETIW